jgi:hypothetical protein
VEALLAKEGLKGVLKVEADLVSRTYNQYKVKKTI